MTVFKTFWKIVNKYKVTIILYTTILIIFAGINNTNNDNVTNFVDSKSKIIIVNNDENIGITKNLTNYIEKNSEVIKVAKDKLDDALFYRDASYIIFIPNNYRSDILNGNNPEIKIKSTNDFGGTLANLMLERYIKIQNLYLKSSKDEDKIIENINKSLETKASINIVKKVNTRANEKLATYFNFASYSIMAIVIFIICLVLASFHEKKINKRIVISSMSYKKHNSLILKSSFIYAFLVFILYIIIALILFKSSLLNIRGLIYIINTFIFTFITLTLAILISNLINNKNALSGIVNVISLSSAFLCGAFIPTNFLPKSVLKFAHILPSYWYINSNNLLINLDTFTISSIKPILINMFILGIFAVAFIIINNLVVKHKQKAF